ncbi:MAG TPA: alkaline phosphatase PafA [Paludibacter sp.]|nr:alkaline phosphatase PafA [Paludibacter sp.]
MKKIIKIILPVFLLSTTLCPASAKENNPARPKLVVGIVVDQMRWDFLYRFYDKYEPGGFKRLLSHGFSCENTMLNYIPSVTAIGHATIFTGAVPAIHGIAGNNWFDGRTGKIIYCTDDPTVAPVGTESRAGKMSPRKLLTTTITDELRLATNFRSKVVGISLKDRAAILPAGNNPTAAFWIDDATGHFVTSSYYMQSLPAWVDDFNNSKPIDKLLEKGWNTLFPIEQYAESTPDEAAWEGTLKGAGKPVFPYDLEKSYALDHGILRQTPFGNTLTLQFARAAIEGYKLGMENSCDFLTINCAATDYAGHLTGPNSIEMEDLYLRLDRDLATFFSYLDKKIGKGNYLLFLTADHGAAHAEGFAEAHKMPAGLLGNNLKKELDSALEKEFNANRLGFGIDNFQVFLNKPHIDSLGLDIDKIKSATVGFLQNQEGIQFAADQDKIPQAPIPEVLKEKMLNGYNWQRSGNVVMVPLPGWLPGNGKGTSHSVWNPYDTHIPLIFMGWEVKTGSTNRTVNMTDIAATLAALLHIQMPSGCIGTPITEITNK